MGLVSSITSFLKRLIGQNEGDRQRDTSTETAPPARPVKQLTAFADERTRREVVKLCRDMYEEDTRAKGVLATLARDAVKGGFTVKVAEGADPDLAQQIAEDLVERLKLFSKLDDWARLSFRDGDSFLEVTVDEGNHVAEVTRKPTLEMHRNSNRLDRFDDPTRAYWWSDQMWVTPDPPRDAVWFGDWQIVHARWDHDEGKKYGTPMFSTARSPYKRMTEGEKDVAIRRKTRAGLRYAHHFPDGTDKSVIEAYQEINKDALNDPFAAVQDFFGTVEIKAVQGDAQLGNIEDIVHHIRTWWVASPVPMSLLGYGQDLNRDVLEEQKEQYDEALPQVTQWVEDQIVKPLLELQWMLKGIWPGNLAYEITWASKRVVTPADVRDVADAISKLQLTGLVSDEMLLTILASMLPAIDIDEAREWLQRTRPSEDERIAAASAGGLWRGEGEEEEQEES